MIPNLAGMLLDGKYRLGEPIGAGGMGVVYHARHERLGRPLAVKLLRPELALDPTAVRRFQQEATSASAVGSPHIVEVLDLGAAPGGAPFLVMEYLRGESLAARLARTGPLPTAAAADIVCQGLAGLEVAHARGIVHRDLKPENLFLVATGGARDFVKLLDFGISKVRLDGGAALNLTQTGEVLGTPRFMAPEQAAGSSGVDHRADLWAMGAILYLSLTGRHPFDAANANAVLAAVLMHEPPPPRAFRPDLDAGLEAILGRALTKDPARRIGSAVEFRASLEPYAGGATPAWPAAPPAGSWNAASASGGPTPPGWTGAPTSPGAGGPTPPGWTGVPTTGGWTGGPTGPEPGGAPAWRTPGTPGGLSAAASTGQTPPRGERPVLPWIVAAVAVLALVGTGIYFLVFRPASSAPGAARRAEATADPERGEPDEPEAGESAADESADPAEGPGVETAATGIATAAVPATSPTPSDAGAPPTIPPMPAPPAADGGLPATREERLALYVAMTVELSCRTMEIAMAEAEDMDPMAVLRFQREICDRYGISDVDYGRLATEVGSTNEAIRGIQNGVMECMMGDGGLGDRMRE